MSRVGLENQPSQHTHINIPRALLQQAINGQFGEQISDRIHGFSFFIAHPEGGVGAGHMIQSKDFEALVRMFGGESHGFLFDVGEGDGFGSKMVQTAQKAYFLLQQFPTVYSGLNRAMRDPLFLPLIKNGGEFPHHVEILKKEIKKIGPKKNIVFPATIMYVEAAAQKIPNAHIISCHPDAWDAATLAVMSKRPAKNRRGITVLHDQQTRVNYAYLWGNQIPAYAWGTLSDPHFLTHFQRKEVALKEGEIHVGVEFSGNRVLPMEKLVKEWIIAEQDRIRNGKIRVTIHTMHHRETRELFEQLIRDLNLGDAVANNGLRIMSASTLEEAINTKHQYIRGDDNIWPPPDIVIIKGGEGPLQDRPGQILVCPYGGGHEGKNILTGANEGRALDYRNLSPKEWLPHALGEIERRKKMGIPINDLPSVAGLFGLATILNVPIPKELTFNSNYAYDNLKPEVDRHKIVPVAATALAAFALTKVMFNNQKNKV